jgi:hypothetical protein
MDLNEYLLEFSVQERLKEMRGKRAHWSQIDGVGRSPSPLRVALGHALIHLGERLQGSIDGHGTTAHDPLRG